MKNKTTQATVTASVVAAVALFSAAPYAANEPAAQNTKTVWVDGKGQLSFADKVNKVHAEMDAEGWKFGDFELYLENGDMRGAFITYVR